MEYYTALESETLSFMVMWREPEETVFSDRSQTQKYKCLPGSPGPGVCPSVSSSSGCWPWPIGGCCGIWVLCTGCAQHVWRQPGVHTGLAFGLHGRGATTGSSRIGIMTKNTVP